MEHSVVNRISILIASYKNAELLDCCLSSLRTALGGHLPETVVVDDAAGDVETRTVVESYASDGVKFIVMPQNGGFAGANNVGYPYCTKEFVVLVNTDIAFHEEPFTTLVAFMDAHPRAGIVQGSLVIRNGQPGVDGRLNGAGSYLTPLGTMKVRGWLVPSDDPVAKEPSRCFAAHGALFMFRRTVAVETGRLFYDFFHSYYEEVDFCHRAGLLGWEVWYVPTPISDHRHGATFSRFCMREEVLRRYYRNMRFSFRTCFGTRGRLLVEPIFSCCCWAQAIIQLLRGSTAAWKAHCWAHREICRLKPEIKAARLRIQSTRTVSDTAFFKAVMRHYTGRDLLRLIRVNL